MTSKAELAQENEKTRRVKEEEQMMVDKSKEAIHDIKKGVENLSEKTEGMEIKDAPELLPSTEKVDMKLQEAQAKIEEARTAQVGDKNLSNYPKIQQVLKDTTKILKDNRELLKDKTQDDTLTDTVKHAANLAQEIKEQSSLSMDKLWTNWTALLTAVAGSSAGNWKNILAESGNVLNSLRYTQDFMKLLNDLQQTFAVLSDRATKQGEPVDQKMEGLNQQWETQRDKLLSDMRNIWNILAQSPLWKQLVTQGNAIKTQAIQVGKETKEEVKSSAQKIADSKEVEKLKEDFKNILQLVVGKNGPSVQPFLDYCSAAYNDIANDDNFSRWASDMSELYDSVDKDPRLVDQEAYQKRFQDLYNRTKDLLDNTVNNDNLRLALRESRRLMRAAKNDPATKKLLEDSGRLLQHISDKKGVNLMDPQLLNEIQAVIVPILVDHFDNAPLPDYHGFDKNALGKFDYTLSGMRLGTTGLIPSKVKVEFRYKAEANPAKLQMERQNMLMYLEASDIQVSLKDVKWTYNRHTIPRFTDNGTLDIATDGKGITLRLKAEMHNYQPPEHASSLGELLEPPKEHKMFDVLKADCTIDNFHVRVSDAGGANVFYEMLAGIWGTKIKHQIEVLIEEKMRLLADKFDAQLYDIVRRATQPSLAQEAKSTLLSAGKSVTEATDQVKSSIASL